MAPVAIRPATPSDAAAIARVRVESWRATYRGMIPDAYLDSLSVDESTAFWQRILESGSRKACVLVADAGGTVVGFASSNLREPRVHDCGAELSAIYVRADHKRQGIGRSLVRALAAAELAKGSDSLIVFVIAGNKGARAFYENMGAQLALEQPFEWDGMPLVEAAYAWHDLAGLAAGRAAVPH